MDVTTNIGDRHNYSCQLRSGKVQVLDPKAEGCKGKVASICTYHPDVQEFAFSIGSPLFDKNGPDAILAGVLMGHNHNRQHFYNMATAKFMREFAPLIQGIYYQPRHNPRQVVRLLPLPMIYNLSAKQTVLFT